MLRRRTEMPKAKKPKRTVAKKAKPKKTKKLSAVAMMCRAKRCRTRSRGPRFHFLCKKHGQMRRAIITEVLGKKPPARSVKAARTSARKLEARTEKRIAAKVKTLPRPHIDRPAVPELFVY